MAPLSEFFKIKVLKKYKLIYTEWLRAVNSEEYQAALLEAYKCIDNHHLEVWVMDSTRNNPAAPDQKWSVEYLGKLLQSTPLKKVAMVRDDELFTELVAEIMRDKIYKLYGKERRLEHLATLEEALQFVLPGEDTNTLITALQNADKYSGSPAE